MACRIRLECHCHRTSTHKRTNQMHSVVRQARNGAHMHKTRHLGPRHHHSPLATTGMEVVPLSCRTLRCSLSRPTLSTNVSGYNSSNNSRAHRGKPARPEGSPRTCTRSSLSVRHRQLIVACRRRRRVSTLASRRISILSSNHNPCLLTAARHHRSRNKNSNASSMVLLPVKRLRQTV